MFRMRAPTFNGHVYVLYLYYYLEMVKRTKMSENEIKTFLPFSLILSLVFGWFIHFTAITFWLVPNVNHNNIFKRVYITFSMQLFSIFTWCLQYVLILIEKFFVFFVQIMLKNTADNRRTIYTFHLENLLCWQNATLAHIQYTIYAVTVRYLLFAWWCITYNV